MEDDKNPKYAITKSIEDGWLIGKGGSYKPSELPTGEWSKKCKNLYGEDLRFNELTMECEYKGIPVTNDFLGDLYIYLAEFGWKITDKDAVNVFTKQAREKTYNPVREYLIKVENDPEIINADLNKLSTTYFGTDDELADEMLRKWLIGAAQRVMEPGSWMDYVFVLKGPQGHHKSAALRTLCKGYFCDTRPASDKDLQMTIACTWVFSFEELETFTATKMAGQIKNLITIREDIFRPPFGKAVGKYPRHSVFSASVNKDSFLKDETGSRRFWVVEVTKKIDYKQIEKDLDQIWKAVMAAYRQGEEPRLSEAGEALSERRNSRFEDDDPFALDAFEYIENISCPSEFSAMQVLLGSGLREDKTKITAKDLKDMGKTLKALGCIKTRQKRVAGGRQHMWTKPPKTQKN